MKERKKSLEQLDQMCAGCHGQGIACKGCVLTHKMQQRPHSAKSIAQRMGNQQDS